MLKFILIYLNFNFKNHALKKFEAPSLASYASLLLSIIISVYLLYSSFNKKEFVYFNSQEVFDNFNMTRELYARGNREITQRQKKIDSLYLQINNPVTTIPKDSLTRLLIRENESLREFNDKFSSGESVKIWMRINTYAQDFAKEHNYQLILGAQNASTLVYGEKSSDITQEFLTYINNKYEGKK